MHFILGMQMFVIKEKVLEGYRMKQPEGCPGDIYEAMTACWDSTPEDRPTFKELHEFLTKYKVSIDLRRSEGSRFDQEDDFLYIDTYDVKK